MTTAAITPSLLSADLDKLPVSKRIGLIALATDHTSELDFSRLCDPAEVGVYVARIAYDNPTTVESLRKTGPRITAGAALILPGEPLDVVAFGCTSATVVLGEEAVADYIHAAKPESKCVTPTSAAFAAFNALNIQRVSVLAPYTPDVTQDLVCYFTQNGLAVENAKCLGLDDDREMARVSHKSIIDAGVQTFDEKADALFISCTAVRAAECAGEIEKIIGKPVITSNQAIIWRSLRLAGIDRKISGCGQLFEL